MRFSRPKKFKLTKITTTIFLIIVLSAIWEIVSQLCRGFFQGNYLKPFSRSPFIGRFGLLFLGIMLIWESKGKAMESQKERVFLLNLGLNFTFWGLNEIMGGYFGYKIIGAFFLTIALVFASLSLLNLIQNIKLLFVGKENINKKS